MCVYLHTNTSIPVPQLIHKNIPEEELLLFFLVYSQGSWGSESLSNSSEATELVMMGLELSRSGFPCIRSPYVQAEGEVKINFHRPLGLITTKCVLY